MLILMHAMIWGDTSLIVALCRGHPEMVSRLSEKGARSEIKNQERKTVLLAAANHHKNALFLRHLLVAGSDINATDNQGRTTLMVAATYPKNTVILKHLLDAGLDINATDECGETALMMAVRKQQVTNINLLLQFGANQNAVDSSGSTVLMQAIERHCSTDTIKILLQSGSNVMLLIKTGEQR